MSRPAPAQSLNVPFPRSPEPAASCAAHGEGKTVARAGAWGRGGDRAFRSRTRLPVSRPATPVSSIAARPSSWGSQNALNLSAHERLAVQGIVTSKILRGPVAIKRDLPSEKSAGPLREKPPYAGVARVGSACPLPVAGALRTSPGRPRSVTWRGPSDPGTGSRGRRGRGHKCCRLSPRDRQDRPGRRPGRCPPSRTAGARQGEQLGVTVRPEAVHLFSARTEPSRPGFFTCSAVRL